MYYRREIDGLRACAVLAVVFFHAGISLFSGGFVGVDVFFVISGFLITSIIYRQVKEGTFTFSDFYWRRFRRILPALYFMIFVVLVVSYRLLDPMLFADLGKSILASALFSSNIYFWSEAGYFQKAAELKPLLHTWSLAVEEQYYLFFPLLIVLCNRYFKRQLTVILIVVGIASFALSTWGVFHKPIATFYLLPTRLWELLIGSWLAVATPSTPRDTRIATACQWVGLILLLTSILVISDKTPFPGPAALLPCIGTALLIWSLPASDSPVKAFLNSSPMNFIGKISYSFYLWHWPLLVLAEYYSFSPLTIKERLVAVGVAFLVAWFSWRIVERPFRENLTFFSKQRTLRLSFVATAVLVLGGSVLVALDGIPGRFNQDLGKLVEAESSRSKFYSLGCDNIRYEDYVDTGLCEVGEGASGNASFILWGDSHAMAWSAVFDNVARNEKRLGLLAAWTGCPPLRDYQHFYEGMQHDCMSDRLALEELVENKQEIETVIIAARWARTYHDKPYGTEYSPPGWTEYKNQPITDHSQVFESALDDTLRWLRDNGKNVVLIASVPEVGVNVPRSLLKNAIREEDRDIRPVYQEFMSRQEGPFAILEKMSDRYDARILYPHTRLCDESHCNVVTDDALLYSDDNHLSNEGALYLKAIAEEALFSR
jgi:peptidoglycan/LPS O-acetylase OafA/YrhL